MDVILKLAKGLLQLIWMSMKASFSFVKMIVRAIDESSSTAKSYGHGQAYGLLHEDKITIAAFVDSTID